MANGEVRGDLPEGLRRRCGLPHGIETYFPFYNEERFHQALDYQTPAAVYQGKATRKVEPIVCGVCK